MSTSKKKKKMPVRLRALQSDLSRKWGLRFRVGGVVLMSMRLGGKEVFHI